MKVKGSDLLRLVDVMHHDKNIDREIIFTGIEAAVQLAAEKKYGEESGITVVIDRDSGEMHIQKKEGEGDPVEIEIEPGDLGRIAAQAAKQVMIQKIREAECKSVYDEYINMKGDLVQGTITRHEGGVAVVSLGKTEAILPRSEQIPGETHHVNERIKAVVLDVKKSGHRVRVILSRTHPDFVRRLFEIEIPEIKERTIEIRALAREAGYRCKIAVSSIDLKVDCVGACVGVRGSRIKNIVDELGGERIDIVRWNDSLQVMIPNALQPAQIEEVFLYPRLGRAIVLVKEDQLSLAIGRRGQNVRLASKLVGWDIEIMTIDELNEGVDRAENWFRHIPGVTDEMTEAFITEGFLSFEDLTFLEPFELAELAGVDEDAAVDIIEYAEQQARRLEEMGGAEAPAEEGDGQAVAVEGGEEAADAEGEFAPEGAEGQVEGGEMPAEGVAEEFAPTEEQLAEAQDGEQHTEENAAEEGAPEGDEVADEAAPAEEEPTAHADEHAKEGGA